VVAVKTATAFTLAVGCGLPGLESALGVGQRGLEKQNFIIA
jgi:hypothetical protein